MEFQEKEVKNGQNENSTFKMFIPSFIVDILVFSGALLTVIVTLIVICMLSGQSKLKTLVTNIAVQCIKSIEAANLSMQSKNCGLGLL